MPLTLLLMEFFNVTGECEYIEWIATACRKTSCRGLTGEKKQRKENCKTNSIRLNLSLTYRFIMITNHLSVNYSNFDKSIHIHIVAMLIDVYIRLTPYWYPTARDCVKLSYKFTNRNKRNASHNNIYDLVK